MLPLCKCSLFKSSHTFFPCASLCWYCFPPSPLSMVPFSLPCFPSSPNQLGTPRFLPPTSPTHGPSEGSSSCMLLPQGFSQVYSLRFLLMVSTSQFTDTCLKPFLDVCCSLRFNASELPQSPGHPLSEMWAYVHRLEPPVLQKPGHWLLLVLTSELKIWLPEAAVKS